MDLSRPMVAPNTNVASPVVDPAARPQPAEASAPDLLDRTRALPGELARLAAERARAESSCEGGYAARTQRENESFRRTKDAIEATYQSESAAAREEHERTSAEIAARASDGSESAKREFRADQKAIKGRFEHDKDQADGRRRGTRWEASTIFEAAEKAENERLKQAKAELAVAIEDLTHLREGTEDVLKNFRVFRPPDPPAEVQLDPLAPGTDPAPLLRERLVNADELLSRLERFGPARFFRGPGVVWLFLIPIAALAYPAYRLLGVQWGAGVSVFAGIAIGVGLRMWLFRLIRDSIDLRRRPVRHALAEAEALHERAHAFQSDLHERRTSEITDRRDSELSRAHTLHSERIAEITSRRDSDLAKAKELVETRLAAIEARRTAEAQTCEEARHTRVARIETTHRDDAASAVAAHDKNAAEIERLRQTQWTELRDRWQQGLAQLHADLAEVQSVSGRYFPRWDPAAIEAWTPAAELPPAIRFGELHLDLDQIPNARPRDPALAEMLLPDYRMPAFLRFPQGASLVIEADAESKARAVEAVQVVLLRMLTGLPAGKVRFTVVDPADLGRNFAGLMHLADFSESVVGGRIWTEPAQIDERLADLSLHLENVIQRYLRNEFSTLEEYNVRAGEIAEPYRILVVADFPMGFSDQTARRLLSIAASGPRCGVYVLLTRDRDRTLPTGITRADLTKHAVQLSWDKKLERFDWHDPALRPYPLTIDPMPPADDFKRLLQRVGEAARAAHRVEVPFEVIAPADGQWWTSDTRTGVDVPLGRSGAAKLLRLQLGSGTSQHVLIAGRTGSGKSTLLHALITNCALMYSPDEIMLYLIDFKKGVEFKVYATHNLPHARVVAIESEREFGLSVLQRLDVELKVRGDLYRDAGAQDVASYRAATGKFLPRIMLIVDEFQEFFVEDDKIAQEAGLLLDRLVRQGRAFGIHVQLGSQTLSGAYSLARSTIGQMAVRIALQCSDSDAHLIMNEENGAARLLSRPGEAIYNDANGQVDANQFFQVVWLPDAKREGYLARVAELARERRVVVPKQIVFEGSVNADIRQNALLQARLEPDSSAAPSKSAHAWLGDPVAIKDPTAATFRRQGGSHLLMIGQNVESARGILSAAIVSLAAQHAPTASTGDDSRIAARFFVLDGAPEETAETAEFSALQKTLPHDLLIAGPANSAALLKEIHGELEKRQTASDSREPSIYLIVADLARFRDLRKSDDDYGFSRKEESISPAKMFAEILREGSALGIHALVWCDSLNNLNRTLERSSLREFEMRVLFQMSAADSSSLIDSPAASRLGPHRALFASEEEGRFEKFRPYAAPPAEWLEELHTQLTRPTPGEGNT